MTCSHWIAAVDSHYDTIAAFAVSFAYDALAYPANLAHMFASMCGVY